MKMIDTLNQRPRIRHIVKEELDRGWILTNCGRRVLYYFNGDCTMHYTDGTPYARYCKQCFREGTDNAE